MLKTNLLVFKILILVAPFLFVSQGSSAETISDDSLEDLIRQQAIMLDEIRLQKDHLNNYLTQQQGVTPESTVSKVEPTSSQDEADVLKFQLEVFSEQMAELKLRNKELEEKLLLISQDEQPAQTAHAGEQGASGQQFSDRLNLLRVQLDKVKEMMRQRESLVSDLKLQNEALSSENLALKTKFDELQSGQDALFKTNLELIGLKDQHTQLTEELRVARAERDESKMNAAVMAQKLVDVETASEKVIEALKNSAEKDQIVLQMKIASLEGVAKASEERFLAREKKFEEFSDERQALSRHLDEEQARNKNLSNQIKTLESQLASVEKKMEGQIAERNRALESQVSKLESRFHSLKQSAADDKEKNFKDQRAYIEELETKVQELTKLTQNQDGHIQTILEDRHQINRKLVEKDQKYTELRKRLSEIVQNREQIERAVEQKILEARLPLESEIKTLKARLNEAEEQRSAQSRQNIATTADELSKSDNELKSLREELEQRIAAMQRLEDEKENLLKELAVLKEENSRIAKIGGIENQSVEVSPDAEIKAQPVATREVSVVEKKLKAAEEKNEDLLQEISLLNGQIKDLTHGSRVPLMEEIALLERKIKKLERDKKELIGSGGDMVAISKRLDEYDARISDLEKEREDLLEKNAQLNKELEQYRTQETLEPLSEGELMGLSPTIVNSPDFFEIRAN